MKSILYHCPSCLGDLALVEVADGRSFIKCRDGCSKPEIIKAAKQLGPVKRTKKLHELVSDQTFSDILNYARSIGKMISRTDMAQEASNFTRAKALKNRGL